VNGRSIALAAMDDRKVIDYFHIELETHEVVFAEGAPAETLSLHLNHSIKLNHNIKLPLNQLETSYMVIAVPTNPSGSKRRIMAPQQLTGRYMIFRLFSHR